MFEKATRFTDIFSSDILSKIAFNGNSDKAFIYIVNLNSCKPLIPKLWRCLCVDEKLRAQRYCDSKLSNFYIISRGILRYILSYYIKQSPQEIEFAYKKNIFDKIILESDYLDWASIQTLKVIYKNSACNNWIGNSASFMPGVKIGDCKN